MAAHLTPKENLLRVYAGEIPEWVPWGYEGFANVVAPPGLGFDFSAPPAPEFEDMFGVPMVMEWKSGPIPKPNVFILDDITKWRDVIKRPPILDEIDWELGCSKVLAERDPELIKYCMGSLGNGYFMFLTYVMGMTNAMIACMEEPEEVKALLNFICDLNIETSKKLMYYLKPDVMLLGDDIAHEREPFVSEAMFLDIFEPVWRRNTQVFREGGCFAQHHNCGRIEPFIPWIVDMGNNAWDPAQQSNDLYAIKWKYDNKFVICGGLENNGFICWPETSDEEVRAEVKRVMDLLAPGGGFAFGGMVMGAMDDEFANARSALIRDEYEKNMYNYY